MPFHVLFCVYGTLCMLRKIKAVYSSADKGYNIENTFLTYLLTDRPVSLYWFKCWLSAKNMAKRDQNDLAIYCGSLRVFTIAPCAAATAVNNCRQTSNISRTLECNGHHEFRSTMYLLWISSDNLYTTIKKNPQQTRCLLVFCCCRLRDA